MMWHFLSKDDDTHFLCSIPTPIRSQQNSSDNAVQRIRCPRCVKLLKTSQKTVLGIPTHIALLSGVQKSVQAKSHEFISLSIKALSYAKLTLNKVQVDPNFTMPEGLIKVSIAEGKPPVVISSKNFNLWFQILSLQIETCGYIVDDEEWKSAHENFELYLNVLNESIQRAKVVKREAENKSRLKTLQKTVLDTTAHSKMLTAIKAKLDEFVLLSNKALIYAEGTMKILQVDPDYTLPEGMIKVSITEGKAPVIINSKNLILLFKNLSLQAKKYGCIFDDAKMSSACKNFELYISVLNAQKERIIKREAEYESQQAARQHIKVDQGAIADAKFKSENEKANQKLEVYFHSIQQTAARDKAEKSNNSQQNLLRTPKEGRAEQEAAKLLKNKLKDPFHASESGTKENRTHRRW